jgi:hypothetical protein
MPDKLEKCLSRDEEGLYEAMIHEELSYGEVGMLLGNG